MDGRHCACGRKGSCMCRVRRPRPEGAATIEALRRERAAREADREGHDYEGAILASQESRDARD